MDLSGKLLIAMPGMGDPRFAQSVVFICAHSEDGAMGLVINKPAPDLDFGELLDQLDIATDAERPPLPVHLGGPVEHGRGFVLHSSDYKGSDATLYVDRRFRMTATVDILEDMARGRGPQWALLALGYAGWGPGQLEDEISANGWLTGEAGSDIIFCIDDEAKWQKALEAQGIDARLLSGGAGRA